MRCWHPTILGLCAVVCGVRSDQVERPSEEASRTNPEAWCDDEPEDAAQKISVVDLTNAGDEQAEHSRSARFVVLGHVLLDGAAASEFEGDAAQQHE